MAPPRIWLGNISPMTMEKMGPQEEVKPRMKVHRAATAMKPRVGLEEMSGLPSTIGAMVKTVATTARDRKMRVPP